MSDFNRIDRMIREAGVQRSAEIGTFLGEFLANSWLGTAAAIRKASAALRGSPARATANYTVSIRPTKLAAPIGKVSPAR